MACSRKVTYCKPLASPSFYKHVGETTVDAKNLWKMQAIQSRTSVTSRHLHKMLTQCWHIIFLIYLSSKRQNLSKNVFWLCLETRLTRVELNQNSGVCGLENQNSQLQEANSSTELQHWMIIL